MIKNKTKIIVGLIGLFIFVFNIGFIFALPCFQTIQGVDIIEFGVEQGGLQEEYRIRINQREIIDKNISFNLATPLPPQCSGKTFILEIESTRTFKLTGTNRYLEISGDVNVIRFNSTAENGFFINFIVDNNEIDSALYNNPGPGVLNIKIPKIEVTTKGGIVATEGERSWIDNEGTVASSKRNGHGVKVILKEVVVNSQKDFNISVVATNPKSHFEKDGGTDACANNTTQHGIHGGVSELILDSIENYGNLNVVVKAADGSVGSIGCYKKSSTGGLGGNGGQAKIDVNIIENYSNLDINVYSGTGANGARGSDEGKWCGGSPAYGGSAGNGADLNYSFKKIFNNNSAKLNLSLNSGNGGTGGRAGYDRCQTDGKRAGGNGGFAGNINILEKTNIENKGKLDVFVLAGFGGQGGQGSRYRATYRGETGKSGSGGSISDYNFSNVINTVGSEFKLNLKSGKININPKKNANNQNRGTATAGSVGSINIDYLNNKSIDFEIITELNEKNINNLNSASCECSSPGSGCSTSGTDPTIGNIKINYLASGSFLPKTLEIRKNAVLDSMPEIEISSCYLMSIGNSQLKYVADSLTLKGTNLETIINDFNQSSKVGQYILIPEYCPVCDSLELDNPLRIDKELSIFSTNLSNIIDLNIFYLDQNGNMFSPPGYISDQNYVVYSLKSGTEIESQGSLLFGEDIREYKLSKEKLHYNPLGLDLDQLEDSGLNLNDIKLFCPGQRYQIVYKLRNGLTVTMPFTPLFNIR